MEYEEEKQQTDERLQKNKKNSFARIVKSIPPKYFLIILGVFVFAVYLIKNEVFSNNEITWYLVGLGMIIFLFLVRSEPTNQLLDEKVIKRIVEKDIIYKQTNTEELKASATYNVGPNVRLISSNDGGKDKPKKYEVKVVEYQQDTTVTVYTWSVHPFTGNVIAIVERPEGYLGNERVDTKIILSPEYAKMFPPELYENEE